MPHALPEDAARRCDHPGARPRPGPGPRRGRDPAPPDAPEGTVLAAGQRFDVRAEATTADSETPPSSLRLLLDGRDVTGRAQPAPGLEGSANLLLRDLALDREGAHVLEARTADAASATVELTVAGWRWTRCRSPVR